MVRSAQHIADRWCIIHCLCSLLLRCVEGGEVLVGAGMSSGVVYIWKVVLTEGRLASSTYTVL